jgi:myo-inositol-1(or 4)-monophosphatase
MRERLAIEVARKAGLFIKSRLGKVAEVAYKGEINLVTDIDKKTESIIVGEIKKNFKEDSILSEEVGSRSRAGDFRWVIDPIDGTTNFFRSFPFFCVSIGLARRDRMVFGAIYDPMRDELFHAKLGNGAFLNKRRIRVSRVKKLSDAFLATGFSYNIRKRHNANINNFRKFLKAALAIRRAGSAALDLAYVACGRFDGFWELDLHPWDTAAGSILVTEAGGKVTKFDGSKYTCMDSELLASNSLIHNQMSLLLA